LSCPKALEWESGKLKILDQTKLPFQVDICDCENYLEVVDAIKTMKVRGAPAIGAACAYGMVLGAMKIEVDNREEFLAELEKVADSLRATRPTAVNLFWALDRMMNVARNFHGRVEELKKHLLEEAHAIYEEDVKVNEALGAFGARLLKDGDAVLTHCNAGALATVGYGTALGILRAAKVEGKNIRVYADETRPFLQGARLTCFELMEDGLDVTLIVDSAAGYCMKKRMIDAVIVGADRVAANGDVANKIGTYSLAVLAAEMEIPFYVAAPCSSIDLGLEGGEDIVIEERAASEVMQIANVRIAPLGVKVFNPAFDVTPHRYVTAIITEKGIVYPPFKESLLKIVKEQEGVVNESDQG
jgi:methylthioribose-1-phosphate isomerase